MQNPVLRLLLLSLLVCLLSRVIPAYADGNVTIDGGAAYTNTTSVTLTISYPPTTTSLDIGEPAGKVVSVPPANTVRFSLSPGDGVKTIRVTAYYTYQPCCGTDSWGNCITFCSQEETAAEEYSSSITLDTVKPVLASVYINSCAQYTNSTAVTLYLSGSDNDQISGMRFGNYTSVWSDAETYESVKSWDLPSGDGYKLVHAQVVDAAGNWSDPISAGILLDTTPPESSISAPATGSCLSGKTVQISGAAADGAGSGVKKVEVSTDGGKTWAGSDGIIHTSGWATWIYSFAPAAEGTYSILSRATDNANNVESPGPGILLTADNTKPSSSIDAFLWKKACPAVAASIAFSPDYANDRTAFAVTPGSGVLKTEDGGAGWSATNSGLTGLNCWKVAVSPAYCSDHSVFIGTESGIFKSTDGGATWSYSGAGLPPGSCREIAFSPDYAVDQALFAGTGGGDIYKTTDGGASWSPAGAPLPDRALAIALSPDFAADNTIFAGTPGAGLFKSTDGGASWSGINSGIDGLSITGLAVSPSFASDNALYIGTAGSVYKSADGGASWSGINSGTGGLSITGLAISPAFASDNTLYIGTGGGVFKSADGGAGWTPCNSGLTGSGVEALAISPEYDKDGTLFAGFPEGIFKSRGDALLVSGASFTITGSASDGGSGVQKVEVSTDGGNTWKGPQDGVTSGGGSWEKWSYTWTVPADGAYSIRSRASDGAGNMEDAGAGITAIVDNTPPVSAISSPTPGAALSGTVLSVNGTATDTGYGVKAVQVLLPVSGSCQWVDAADTSGDGSWSTWRVSATMPADSVYMLESRAINYSNIIEAPASGVSVTADNAEPSSAVTSPRNGALLSGAELALTGKATDNSGLGIARVQVLSPATGDWVDADDTSGNGSWSAWSYSTAMPADGKYALESRAVDGLGNIETPTAGNNITVDDTKPAGGISINNGSSATNKTPVTLTLSAADSSGVTEMRACGDGDIGAVPWESFSASKDWSLPPGDGEKTIYAQFMDAAGNISDTCSANIFLDTACPVVNITAPEPSSILCGSNADIAGTAWDGGSGLDKVEISVDDGPWTEVSGGATWNFLWPLPSAGNFTISARATDKAGNVSAINSIPISIDNISPAAEEPADNAVRPAAYTLPPAFPDPPVFKWAPNACGNFKIYFSGSPDFKKSLKFASDNHGISPTFNPTEKSWNKITKLGGEIFWKVAGKDARKDTLHSASRKLFLDGGFTDIPENTSTDVLNIPEMECDPGASSSISVQFSSEPYFTVTLNSPKLEYGSTVSYTPGKGMWSNITRSGPAFYWRFSGKLPTGETTFSETHVTSVTGGPEIAGPSTGSALESPPVITWDTAGFESCKVQASADEDFLAKALPLGSSKTGSVAVGGTAWKKVNALGSPVYVRVVGTTEEKYTAYGPPVRLEITK
jgi:Bacterial Ig domain/Photosynthesis system II assembly factor YCF48